MPTTPRSRSFSALISLILTYAVIISFSTPPLITHVVATPLEKFGESRNRPTLSFANSVQLEWRSGELLVRFRAGVAQQSKDTVLAARGTRRQKQLRGASGIEKLEVLGAQDPETVALQLRLQPEVEFAEPNFLIKKDQVLAGDPKFDEQWALRNTGQTGGQFGSDINVATAWQTTTGAQETVIAVIDSGNTCWSIAVVEDKALRASTFCHRERQTDL